MKIRKDFVTNSSSSSFIVIFDKVPQSREELQKMLFGEEKFYYYVGWPDIEEYPTVKVAETVWGDLTKQIKHGWEDLWGNQKRSFAHILSLFSQEYDDEGEVDFDGDWDLGNLIDFIHFFNKRKKEIKKLREAYDEGRIFIFRYGDDYGPYKVEHGGLFANLKHYRISEH